jgi:MFS family permease
MTATSSWWALKNPTFSRLWFATVVSGTCVSAHDTAATWMMYSISQSTLLLSLISTAATLPFFLFILPAGALADIAERKKVLYAAYIWLAVCAGGLAVLGWLHLLTPYVVLGSVFLIAAGFAFNAPAFSAAVPEIVSNEELPSASILSGLQLNISAIAGPALAGVLLLFVGANTVFLLNALCSLLVVIAIAPWKPTVSKLPLEAGAKLKKPFFMPTSFVIIVCSDQEVGVTSKYGRTWVHPYCYDVTTPTEEPESY